METTAAVRLSLDSRCFQSFTSSASTLGSSPKGGRSREQGRGGSLERQLEAGSDRGRGARARGLLGGVVRAVPHDRPRDRRPRDDVRRPGQGRQAQHRREPRRGSRLRGALDPDAAGLQGRAGRRPADRRAAAAVDGAHARSAASSPSPRPPPRARERAAARDGRGRAEEARRRRGRVDARPRRRRPRLRVAGAGAAARQLARRPLRVPARPDPPGDYQRRAAHARVVRHHGLRPPRRRGRGRHPRTRRRRSARCCGASASAGSPRSASSWPASRRGAPWRSSWGCALPSGWAA